MGRLESKLGEGVAHITLNQRTLTKQGVLELKELSEACMRDESIEKVILTGTGDVFCYGGDLKEFAEALDTAALVREMATNIGEAILNFTKMKAALVVIVNGNVGGVGLSLVACADAVVSVDTAKFASGYAKNGLYPDGGLTYFLPAKIGPELARKMLEEDIVLDSEEAFKSHLVDCVASDVKTATQIAESLTPPPKEIVKKDELKERMEREIKEITLRAGTKETREKIRAFLSSVKSHPQH